MSTSAPVLRTTTTVSIEGTSSRKASTSGLMAATLPLRRAQSTVIRALASVNSIRSLTDSGREAAEHHVVGRTDARAGQHGHRHLGDHRKEDPDHVAGLDPALLQHVGQPLDVAEQLGVGHVALLALLPAPVVGHPVAAAGVHVAVERVVGGVQLAAGEPLVEGGLGLVEHLVPGLEPVERLGLLGPPGLRVARGLLVHGLVRDQRVANELLGRIERLLVEQLAELALDLVRRGLGAAFHPAPSGSTLSGEVLPERGGAHAAPLHAGVDHGFGSTLMAAVAAPVRARPPLSPRPVAPSAPRPVSERT